MVPPGTGRKMFAPDRGLVSRTQGDGSSRADLRLKKDTTSKQLQHVKTLEKTQLCTFFANGACARGEECKFAHGMEEVRKKPNLERTRLCADVMNFGCCKKGPNCNFAHSTCELRGRTRASKTKAAAKLSDGKKTMLGAAVSLQEPGMLAEALQPRAAPAPSHKEHEEEKLAKQDEEEENNKCESALVCGPVRTTERPMQASNYRLSHLDESRILIVKNTFIHVLEEDLLHGLHSSVSSPLLVQHPST